MLVASAAVVIAFYWNILAYLLLFPLAVRFIGRGWQFWAHALFGLVAAVLLAVNTTHVPVAALFDTYDRASVFNFGWRDLETEMRAATAEHPDAFLAATRFNSAAQLAFALQDPEVTAIRPETDQFDYWFDPATHAGRDALILSDSDIGIDHAATHFERVTLLREVPISRQGRPLLTYRIYLGEGYAP
jgi:hypothetical protein